MHARKIETNPISQGSQADRLNKSPLTVLAITLALIEMARMVQKIAVRRSLEAVFVTITKNNVELTAGPPPIISNAGPSRIHRMGGDPETSRRENPRFPHIKRQLGPGLGSRIVRIGPLGGYRGLRELLLVII